MKYLIPNKYILYVGNIEERKNILNIIKAIHRAKINYPFVIVGRTSRYMSIVKAYIENYNLKNIYFLQNVPSEDLPAIYQMAELFVYPSFFEGFGIPILEALVSKVPVITSKGGCFAEAGGKSTIYVDPYNPHEIGEAINAVLKNPILKENMIVDGYMHAQKFRHEVIAQQLIKVYELFI